MFPFKGAPLFNASGHGHPIPPDPANLVGTGLIAPPPPTVLATQWPLNKAAYQDLANDQVDWAALAQQWIHMKETCPTDDMPVAPPPPIISGLYRLGDEKGEAPMEMDRDDEEHIVTAPSTNPFSLTRAPAVPPRLNEPPPNWKQPSADGPSVWQQAPPPAGVPQQWNKRQGWNSWSNNNQSSGSPGHPVAPGTSGNAHAPHQHQHKNWHPRGPSHNRMAAANRSEVPEQTHNVHSGSNSPTAEMPDVPVALDAAKRKTLPPWIRLGLEKMEREKQKSIEQEERDRLNREKQERQKLELLAISSDITLGSKSKFDSDSDASSDHDEPSMNVLREATSKPIVPAKSRQEQLQEMMLLVRSSLTEILLEVTNEEIRSIANETLSTSRQKGLGIYADSDDEAGSSGDDSHNGSEANAGDESDIELRETIKRRKKLFEDRTREIEAQVAADAERERRWLEDDVPEEQPSSASAVAATMSAAHLKLVANSRRASRARDADIGEVQQHEQKIIQSHARPTDRKISRFSDPKDTVRNLQLTHGSLIYEPTATKSLTIIPQSSTSAAHHSDSDGASVASSMAASVRSLARRHAESTKRSKRPRDSSDESSTSHRRKRDRKEKRRYRSRSRSSSSDRSSRRGTGSSKSTRKRRTSRDSRQSSTRSHRRSESREPSKSSRSKRSSERRRSRSRSRDRRHHSRK